MRAVIMAGGEGTRLRPFTHVIPKPLLPIGRKPVAHLIVERLRDCGITEIVMSVGHGAELIRAYFQDGRQFGVRITYFAEARKMGTAGCLAHIPQLRDEAFLVTNGDILTRLDYAAFLRGHTESGAALTVATREETLSIPYGVLRIEDGRVRGVEEKPRMEYCFSAGVYALAPKAVAAVPAEGVFDMTDLINRLVQSGEMVRPHPVDGLWFDLARVDDFDRAITELERIEPEFFRDTQGQG